MTPDPIADCLARRKSDGQPSVVVYFMVDAHRRAVMRSLARACRSAGVAGLELGFPFSDPVADGPVLQRAATRALQNGTQWEDLLHVLGAVSQELPVAVMTYANPVWHRGLEPAMSSIAEAGGSGLIVPDLSLEESGPWRRAARKAGISLVQMGSPASAPSRIRQLADVSAGFLYLVSRYGTTGTGSGADAESLRRQVAAAHAARPELPVLLGFGVRQPSDLLSAGRSGADGAVVGTAIEERLARSLDPVALEHFLRPWTAVAGGRLRSHPTRS